MKKIIKAFYEDWQTALDNHEEYQRLQVFFKGKLAERSAVIDHMHLNYVPKFIKLVILWKAKMLNNFFQYWLSFHRISFLTVVMITLIIILLTGGF